MNVVDYVEHLTDELKDAEMYIKKAIACKNDHPNWASIWQKNSSDELNHAQNVVKVFEDDYETLSDNEKQVMSSVKESILDMYTDGMAKVRMMHQTYSEK